MPAIIRVNTDLSQGHCFNPRVPITAEQGSVFVNGVEAVVVGGYYPVHFCGVDSHDGTASGVSGDVFIEGKGVHRNGDAISCGDTAANGSPDVFANG